MIYKWAEGARIRGLSRGAQAVGEYLEALRREKGGKLTARTIVNDARDEDSLLHAAFEWDDQLAAEAHRLEQARHLIRSVVVMRDEPGATASIRAFVIVSQGVTESYSSTYAVMKDPALRAQVLARAKKELIQWRTRYQELREFAELFGVIDKSVEDVA